MQPSRTVSITNTFVNALAAEFGGVTQAARALGVPRSTLYGHALGREARFAQRTADRISDAFASLSRAERRAGLLIRGVLEREAKSNIPELVQEWIDKPELLALDLEQSERFIREKKVALEDWAEGRRS